MTRPPLSRKLALAAAAAAVLATAARQSTPQPSVPEPVTIRLETWSARIIPENLSVYASASGAGGGLLAATAGESLGGIRNLRREDSRAMWEFPSRRLKVEVTARGDRLHWRFESEIEAKLSWPVSGGEPRFTALLLPDGEGLYIPLDDAFWRARLSEDGCRTTYGGLSMPFWSLAGGGRTITFLALSDLRTELCFEDKQSRLAWRAVHDFRRRDGLPAYEVAMWLGGESPLSPALEFREWLQETGEFRSLDEKIAANPEVAKLLGATHAYLYGDGRSLSLLEKLRALGVDRIWLGYDQDPRRSKHLVAEEVISEAKRLGYLIGPYDSFANIQDPETADAPNAVWDAGLYPAGCIINQKGELQNGFGGRGCELSSEALARLESSNGFIAKRLEGHIRTGINSYFLDVDAAGELFNDYSPDHPMTLEQDRRNRLARMKSLSEDRKMVLGSETARAWAVPVLHFSHGAHSVQDDVLWPLMRRREMFGGWWPPERPAIFFRPVRVDGAFAKARYDPTFRLPLFQASFHDSLVTTDRWELSALKLPALAQTRALIELLYNVPSIWSLDLRTLDEHGERLAAHHRFFSKIHRQAGRLPLSDFRWLTADRKVQQTRFGNEIILTANFADRPHDSVPPQCIAAVWLKENRKELFCPPPAEPSARPLP